MSDMTLQSSELPVTVSCAQNFIDESKYSDYESMYLVACPNCRAVLDQGKAAAVRLVGSPLGL